MNVVLDPGCYLEDVGPVRATLGSVVSSNFNSLKGEYEHQLYFRVPVGAMRCQWILLGIDFPIEVIGKCDVLIGSVES